MFVDRHNFYAAADPGHKGAIALMNAAGTSLKVWPMPSRGGDLDLPALRVIFQHLKRMPGLGYGVEWPQPWPGAFNNVIRDAENFGRQKGVLEVFGFLHNLPTYRISPVTWKGKLGLDGKTRAGANERAAAAWDGLYPAFTHMVRGPRGGLLDGPLDACLIAHYMRLVSGVAAKTADRGSVEHLAAVLGSGPGKRRLCRMPLRTE